MMQDWEDWQKPYQFGTLVIWPPDEVRQTVNQQRQEFDPESQAICETHITVTPPLVHSPAEKQWQEIEQIVSAFRAFEITYGPLRSFLPYPCIWHEIQPMESVLEIRRALLETGHFNRTMRHLEDFVPHMTITEGLSGPEVNQELLAHMASRFDGGTFWCEDLAYIVPDEGFHFQVVKRIPLGKV
ncbi:MAG: 2'-5' RNA ligase family protein [Anaerolineales bacterium]|jgi:2'-5' RNA ligase